MAYKPSIGDTGFFELRTPYDKLLTPNVSYTCQSIRTISDYIRVGESVYERFYAPLEVAEDYYQQDLLDDVYIVGLQAGTGDGIYVPSSFIVAAPVKNGIKYISLVLGVELGAIPDNYNLESIKKQFTDIVLNGLGIESTIKGVLVGTPKYFSQEEHEMIMAARDQKISMSTSSVVLAQQYRLENDRLQSTVAQYEKIFKTILPRITPELAEELNKVLKP